MRRLIAAMIVGLVAQVCCGQIVFQGGSNGGQTIVGGSPPLHSTYSSGSGTPGYPCSSTQNNNAWDIAYNTVSFTSISWNCSNNGGLTSFQWNLIGTSGGGSMTWPSGAAGIPNYSGSSAWGTTYSASNKIPANFLSLSGYLALSGGTLTGKLITPASTTSAAGLNLPAGYAPTSPVNGDIWSTSAGVYAQVNGSTVGPFAASGGGMIYPGAGIGNSTGGSWGISYSALNPIPANFISTLNQNTTGSAATAAALSGTPTLCSTGSAPTGILANGNATGCASIASGLTLQTIGTNNTSQSLLNFVASTVNAAGLTATPVNATSTEKFEITGTVNLAAAMSGGAANDIPYQTGANASSFIAPVDSAVLVTNASGVPSESTTLPAVSMANLTGMTSSQVTAALGYTPAHSGSNSDITALSGLTTLLSPAQGGTGAEVTGLRYGNGAGNDSAATAPQVVSAIGSTAVTNATNAANTYVTASTTNANFYLTFASSLSSGNQGLNLSSYLTYNPSTGVLNINGGLGIGSSPPTGCPATGCFAMAEAGTAGTPTSAVDYLRADSITHQILTSRNGGPEAISTSGPYGLGSLTYNASGTTTFAAAGVSIVGAKVTATHSTSTTFSPTGLVAWGSYTLEIVQDSTGGGVTFTLGTGGTCSAWKVGGSGAGAITLSTTASAIDVLAFTYDGTNCVANFRTNFD